MLFAATSFQWLMRFRCLMPVRPRPGDLPEAQLPLMR